MNISRGYPIPDIVIYLDINPEISLARTRRRSMNEHFENLDTLKKESDSLTKKLFLKLRFG